MKPKTKKSKPRSWPPVKPVEPKKTIVTHSCQHLFNRTVGRDDELLLSIVIDQLRKKGVESLDDLRDATLRCIEDEYGDSSDFTIEITKSFVTEVDNPRYAVEKERYDRQLKAYEADLVEYQAFVNEQKKIQLENDIKDAMKLLKKHGKL